mmetsp:Transcript_39536/g.45012  ORF Transcript_39536/g.45012 Transcript_39536/m.45012 type:complete len:185 (-) Transcript_39536:185-739(-)
MGYELTPLFHFPPLGQFDPNPDPTIGAAFMTQAVQVGEEVLKFDIWDTAGQERFRSLTPMYYRGAAAAIVVYDITERSSFEGAKSWVRELLTVANPNIIIGMAGNKCDCEEKRVVPTTEAEAYAEENSVILFETSAKDNINISEIFERIASRMPKSTIDDNKLKNTLVINSKKEKENGWVSSCC